jgi:signal transduction histidine kinase
VSDLGTPPAIEALARLVRAQGHPNERRAALEAALDAALGPLGLARGAVYLRPAQTDELELAAHRGIPAGVVAARRRQEVAPRGTGLAGAAAHRRDTVVAIDLEREPLAKPLADAFRVAGVAVSSAAAVPVVVEGHAVGAILVVAEKPHTFTEAERAHLALVAALLGWTLVSQKAVSELAKMNEELKALTRALEQRMAELKELDRFKTRSIHLITHELRKPLSPIFTYADMLLGMEFPPEKRRQFLETIRAAAQEMDKYVAEMVEAAKLEEGGVQLVFGDVDVVEVARTAVGQWQQAAADAGVALELSADLKPSTFTTDGVKIGEVLENLIENAVKYTPQGGRVSVRVGRVGDALHFAVSDTGIGIPPEEVPSLFAKFHIVAQAEVPRPAHRAGLGLYLAKVYAEAMGGAIDVDSQAGKGSTFTLRVPIGPRG